MATNRSFSSFGLTSTESAHEIIAVIQERIEMLYMVECTVEDAVGIMGDMEMEKYERGLA